MSIGVWAQAAIFTQVWVSRYETYRFSAGRRVINGHPGFGASQQGGVGTLKKLVPLSSIEGRDHRFKSLNKDNLLHCNKILNCKKKMSE